MRLPGKAATYRAFINITSLNGISVELTNGSAAGGTRTCFKRLRIKTGGATTLTVNRYAGQATSGTSAAVTPGKNDSTNPTPNTTVKTWSVAPTPNGTLQASYAYEDVAAAGNLDVNAQTTDQRQDFELQPGECMTLELTTAVTLKGYVEWSEEPV